MDVWRALEQGADLICTSQWHHNALNLYLKAAVESEKAVLVVTSSQESAANIVKTAEKTYLEAEIALIDSGKAAKVQVCCLLTPIDPGIQASVQLLLVDIVDSALSKHLISTLEATFRSFPTTPKAIFTNSLSPCHLHRLSLSLSTPISLFSPVSLTLEGLKHYKVDCETQNGLLEIVQDLLDVLRDNVFVMFCRKRRQAELIADLMAGLGLEMTVIHAKMPLGRITEAINGFKAGRIKALLACDPVRVSSRVAIHYQVPSFEQYLMRVGQGRLGGRGLSIVLMTAEEGGQLREIERRAGVEVEDLPADIGSLL